MVTSARQFDRFGRAAMGRSCLCPGSRSAPAAFLAANSRRDNFFLDAHQWQLAGNVSRGRLLGSDGASLGWPVGDSEDPIGIAGGINLYGYANDSPLTRTDPYGLQTRGTGGITMPDPGSSGPLPAPWADQITLPIQFSYVKGSYWYDWTARWRMENDLVKANEVWAQCHIAFTSTTETPTYRKVGQSNAIDPSITMDPKYSPSDFGFWSEDSRSRTSIYVTYIGGFQPLVEKGINKLGDEESRTTVVLGQTLRDPGGMASENILLGANASYDTLAHELGHVLMGGVNRDDPADLMHHPSTDQTGHKISVCECETARKRAKELIIKWKTNGTVNRAR
jgi:hypothetical protein